MRLEIILFIISAFVMFNIYTEGKAIKNLMGYKKYYQMAGVGIGAIFIYMLIKKNPLHAQQIITQSNEYLKYLPVDKNTSSFIHPILDFTSKYSGGRSGGVENSTSQYPILNMSGTGDGSRKQSYSESRITSSGSKGTKRSVSETKKKWVAAKQNWRCGTCHRQLPPWFEVDHKIRLEHGGSNHVDNLVAMCRDCHGEKTAIENL